ncbi:aspartate/glutamate racemase family protein [Streptomyces venezuelae]|uniref:Aspartate/glutamate racemase family protein n=2 Tax=Streptomyces venezuelae TaxID=54571 RepID=A0A5P2CTD9_STRVZ|nr:aspartate/glutamate racemase family protein [Streptomyces venezuelae]
MRRTRRPMLGILGGMGPLATAAFYRKLVERTPADADQGHLPVIVWADPGVPDRTSALLGEGPSPLPALVEGAREPRRPGATCIAVPCNTAYAYVEQVTRVTGVEVVDMIDAALEQAARSARAVRRVGVLTTRGTRAAGLYERAGARLGLTVVQVPDEAQCAYVDPAIRAVKAGADMAGAARWIAAATRVPQELGAQVAVAACTEIPLVAGEVARVLPMVDSAEALADRVVDRLWRPSPREFVPGDGNGRVISCPRTDAQERTGPNLRR